ncbi:MAG: hypothetical protein Kow0022_07050 [Phycisphaerales bacterium]
MAILLRCGAVFVHVPKTGGTWVTEVLRAQGCVRCRIAHKHADLEHLREAWRHYPTQLAKRTLQIGPGVGARVRRGTKFCFVRHPVRWYESYFRFMKSLGWRRFGGLSISSWHPNAELFDLGDDNFDTFMRRVLDRVPGYLTQMYDQFVGPGRLEAEADGLLVSQDDDPARSCRLVGRQERLVDDLLAILDRLGVPVDAGQVRSAAPRNVSRRGREGSSRRGEAWDSGTLKAVLEAERGALQRFGYDVEPSGGEPTVRTPGGLARV